MRLAPRHAEAARYRAATHEPDHGETPGHRPRRRPIRPEFTQGTIDSVDVGVIDALVPGTRALGELRVVAYDIDGRAQDAVFPGLRILRHEEQIASLFAPDLMNK